MSAEARLKTLSVALPVAPKAVATYSSWVRSGNLVFVAGQGPMVNGTPKYKGKLGANVTLAQGQECARIACLNALAIVKEALGSLDKVKRVVKANVYVACTNDFTDQPKVANGATELIKEIWGEGGLPVRAAVGVNVLPMDIPVELELVVEA
ncbi:MAG TPA: RidA family protein [Candidatus Thermoplasmatota archaeon]|nr:RidA family protein [Candidatus Thermoplasmatota archaeon]